MRPLLQRRPSETSPKTRYFWARFRALKQPKVWATGLGLVGLVVFAHEFSQRPDWQQAFRPNASPTLNQPSPEDLAIAADIDSLPLLLAPPKPQPDGTAPGTGLPPVKNNGFPLSSLFGNATAAPNPLTLTKSTPTNAAAPTPAPSLVPGQPATTNALATALATPSRRTSAYIEGQPSALASAVARYSQPEARPEMANLTPTSSSTIPTPNTSWNTTTPTQGSVPIPTSNYDPGLPAVPFQGNNPAPLGNSYPINSYTGLNQAPLAPIEPPVTNVAPFAPTAPQQVAPPQDLPFTAPRSIPGRSIGGGEIGTFSNP
jgi:hypothetical protein